MRFSFTFALSFFSYSFLPLLSVKSFVEESISFFTTTVTTKNRSINREGHILLRGKTTVSIVATNIAIKERFLELFAFSPYVVKRQILPFSPTL